MRTTFTLLLAFSLGGLFCGVPLNRAHASDGVQENLTHTTSDKSSTTHGETPSTSEANTSSGEKSTPSETLVDSSGTTLTFRNDSTSATKTTPPSEVESPSEPASDSEPLPQTSDMSHAIPFALLAISAAIVLVIAKLGIKRTQEQTLRAHAALLPQSPDWVWPQNWRS